MIDSLCLELSYKKRGVVTTSRSTENIYLLFSHLTEKDSFLESVKKSLKILNENGNFFDGEIALYTSTDYGKNNRELLIIRDYKDRENDTYSVYEYGVNCTDIKQVGKKALMNVFNDTINNLIEKYNNYGGV